MNLSPELIGRLTVMACAACLSVAFLLKGAKASTRSLRLANIAIGCGFLALARLESAFDLSPMAQSRAFFIAGALRVPIGLAGLSLVFLAFRARGDGGAGAGRLTAAAALCLIHLIFGVGDLIFGTYNRPGTPWVYAPPAGYRLTLPSADWKECPTPGRGVVAFFRKSPPMRIVVVRASENQSEADFERRVKTFRMALESNPEKPKDAQFRNGVNPAGNPYHYLTATEIDPKGRRVRIAFSTTWCPKKKMVVEASFEGWFLMISEEGQKAEREAFERSAEGILLSVE